MRWSIQIQEFNLSIQHIAGRDNIGADTLTRYVQMVENEIPTNQKIFINQLFIDQYSKELTQKLQQLPQLQQEDDKIKKIIRRLNTESKPPYLIYQRLLFYVDRQGKNRIMIPDKLAHQLIKEVHEQYGHSGATKVYQILKQNCQLSHMFHTIKRITQSCDICQKSKVYNQMTRGPLLSNLPTGPRELISLDLIGPLPTGQLGAKYILVIIDVFSKYLQTYPLRKATAETILKRNEKQYIPNCGSFKKILTDNGTQFHSKKWTLHMKKIGVKILRTTAYHPEGNPVERANREIGRMLRTYCHKKHTNWVQYLKRIEFWMNHITHSTTGYTPQELMGQPRQTLILEKLIDFPQVTTNTKTEVIIQKAMERLKKSAQQRSKCLDRGKKFIKYTKGQSILVKEHRLSSTADREIKKLFLLYRGPYTILKVGDNITLVINEEGKSVTYNVKNVKPYILPDPGGLMDRFVC